MASRPNILEQAGHISISGEPTAISSDPGGGQIRDRIVESNFMAEITCLFPRASRGIEVAVDAFCDEYRHLPFDFKAPDSMGGGSAIISCVLVDRPDVRHFLNGRIQSITVRLRRTLLVD